MIDGTPTQLLASWMSPDPTNGEILNYTVRCTNVNQTSIFAVIVAGDSLMVLLEGLSPYTFYSCNVSANTSTGEGPSTDSETAQTDESGNMIFQAMQHVIISKKRVNFTQNAKF